MNDTQIVAALIAEIKTQLGIYGIPLASLRVARANQPTRQNAGALPYEVYIQPISNTDIGWGRQGTNAGTLVTHTKQKTYQINALTEFNPSTGVGMPAQELAHTVHDMLEHPDAIRALKNKGVNVLSCNAVRPLYWQNEQDEFEPIPSFDIVVNYVTEYVKPVPIITEVTGDIEQV